MKWQDPPVFVLLCWPCLHPTPALPVQPEARQNRRPLPTAGTEAATFDHVLPCTFPYCSVVGLLLVLETTIPT